VNGTIFSERSKRSVSCFLKLSPWRPNGCVNRFQLEWIAVAESPYQTIFGNLAGMGACFTPASHPFLAVAPALPAGQPAAQVSYAIAIPSFERFGASSRMPSALARARSVISRHSQRCASWALHPSKCTIGGCSFNCLTEM
jgi:hypothetical protein